MDDANGQMGSAGPGWLLLIYRVPGEPSRVRVGVWRELKRLGGLYLQSACCILPARPGLQDALTTVRARIAADGGTSTLLYVAAQPPDAEDELVSAFRDLASKEYAEVIEECDTKFVREIEFERFRGNYTFEEVEEIRADLDKIRRWLDRVITRDFFGARGRAEAHAWLAHCAGLLEAFEADVYERTAGGRDDHSPPAPMPIKPPPTSPPAG
ncbi:MAG: Chromate resistance protein ChrB [Egibacteraceae bacterium]